MMSQNRPEIRTVAAMPDSREYLSDVLEMLDELHTAVSEGNMADFTDMSNDEIVAMLREVVYTAQETIKEIQTTRKQKTPVLHLVEKIDRAG